MEPPSESKGVLKHGVAEKAAQAPASDASKDSQRRAHCARDGAPQGWSYLRDDRGGPRVSTPRAFEIVNDALKALVAEPTEQVRKLEIERIDHMLSVVWATATNAMSEVTVVDASLLDMILKAQAGVLKLMERRAKLTGLDARPDLIR